MTALRLGCARRDCCERQPAGGESDPEAIGERVAKEVLEAHLGPLMSKGSGSLAADDVPAVSTAITEALTAAAPGVAFRLAVHGGLYGGGGTSRVGTPQLPRRWEPCSGYEPDDQPDTIDVVVGGGLCVVAGPRRTWIVHSPAARSVVSP